jgi:hypothetical protein
MKRKLLIGFATIGLLLTACSQDEVVSGIGAITFSGTYVDNHTRATNNSITKDNISNVYVYGYRSNTTNGLGKIFDNEDVAKKNGAWTYTHIQFWESTTDYAFTAITPSSTDAKWTYTPSDAKIDGKGSLTFDNKTANGEKDLCTSVQTTETGTITATNYPGDVKFTMKHRLARVMFRFKNGFQNTTDKIEVSKLQLNDAISQGTLTTSATEDSNTWSNTSGTFNLTFKTWTGTASATDNTDTSVDISSTSPLTVDPNSQTDGTWSANEKETNTKFLIPSTATSYNVELYAEVKNASGTISKYDKTTTPATFSIPEGLKAGYSYVITVEFSGNEIKFTVYTVTPWDDETNIPISTSSTPSAAPKAEDIIGEKTVVVEEKENDKNEGVKTTDFDNTFDKIYVLSWGENWGEDQTYFRKVSDGVYEITFSTAPSEFRIICADTYGTETSLRDEVWKFSNAVYGTEHAIEVGKAYYLYARQNKTDGNLPYIQSPNLTNVKITFAPNLRLLTVESIDEADVQEERVIKYKAGGEFISDTAGIVTE